jgi:hypothetical protein
MIALVDTELVGDLGDRTRRLDHHLDSFFPILRREVPLRTGKIIPFQTTRS